MDTKTNAEKELAELKAQIAEFIVKYEVQTNASIKRLMLVNDVYGSPTLRQAILDELNGQMRAVRKCLTSTASADIIKTSYPVSTERVLSNV